MKIEFINHSSLIINIGKEKILCDPWYKGSAFANGWRLLYDEKIDINKLDFDILWISHEHPDHFSIPTLKSLKQKKPVLYQKTKDKKIKRFLNLQGHKVTEMENDKKLQIGPAKISCIVTEGYDSCLLVEEGNFKFLNINDSQLDKDEEIKKISHHTPIDLISIQFHYANWAGNKGDDLIPEFKRKNVVERIIKIADICKTTDVILFASFVYYAHEENFYWNRSFSHFQQTLDDLENKGLNVILMKPGQKIEVKKSKTFNLASKNNKESLLFWKDQYQRIEIKEFTKGYELETIKKLYFEHFKKIESRNNIEKLRESFLRNFRLKVFIKDLNIEVILGLFEKFFEKKDAENIKISDVSMSSEALVMLLKNDFALGSITISSRIQFDYDNVYKFYFFFLIPYRNNLGIFLKNSINKELKFDSFKTNGVMKPIFNFNQKAKENFEKFNHSLSLI